MNLPKRTIAKPPKHINAGLPALPKRTDTKVKSTKKYSVESWGTSIAGEKIIIYADSGMGKTTLSAMAPKPVFVALDEGSCKIKHPLTGESLNHVPDIKTFDAVRAALQQSDLFDDYETIIIDTGTILELLALDWTLENIKHEKGKITINRIEDYGWGKGYRHLYDTMRLPLADFDRLIHKGKNIIIICQMDQVEVANAGGEDFLCDIPKLQKAHGKSTPSVWGLYNEWADHVFKIGYESIKSEDGKAVAGSSRAIFIHPEIYFKAKSRTISPEFPIIAFDSPVDSSIWQFMFPEKYKE